MYLWFAHESIHQSSGSPTVRVLRNRRSALFFFGQNWDVSKTMFWNGGVPPILHKMCSMKKEW